MPTKDLAKIEDMPFSRYGLCHDFFKNSSQLVKTRMALLIVFICLVVCLVQLFFNDSLPQGLNLCRLLDKDLDVNKLPNGSWWEYICLFEREVDKPVEYYCRDERWVGNWKVCFDEKYRPRDNCLVYSFGIANDFSFDEGMADRGCEVFSFDPSIGLKDHLHSKNVNFMNMGLNYEDNDRFLPRSDEYVTSPQIWKVRTLKSVREILHHQQRTIDILKFDVEGSEWEIMKNIIQDNQLSSIRQVLTEWHIFPHFPPRNRLKSNFEMLKSLSTHGLQRFYKHSFLRSHRHFFHNSQSDACYVNTAFA